MDLKEGISYFSFESILGALKSNPVPIFQCIETFSSRDLSISEMGIEQFDRKLLYVWKGKGLLPHQLAEKTENDEKKPWGKFSFIEVCWIKLLVELRSVGIGMTKLKEVKDFFHPPGFTEIFFENQRPNFDGISPEILENIEKKGLLKNGNIVISEKTKIEFEKIQFSLFSLLIYSTILQKANYVLHFDGKKNFGVIDLDQTVSDSLKGTHDIKILLETSSTVFVNITKLITETIRTHEYFSKNTSLHGKISSFSIDYLKKLFQDNDVEEVTIRANKEGNPVIHVKRQMSFDQMENQVRKLTKRGTFRDVLIKSRNGNLKYFELTEIVQLK
jgi:hypothetical protein